MQPYLLVRNLPPHLHQAAFEKILGYHRISWKQTLIDSNHDAAVEESIGYIVLKNENQIQFIKRELEHVEVSDKILSIHEPTEEETENIETLLETQAQSKQRSSKNPHETNEETTVASPEVLSTSSVNLEHSVAFASMGLSEIIVENLSRRNFVTTTPIQAVAIPPAMEGCDLVGRAQTGTGKTFAFSIPVVEKLIREPGKGIRSLILAPTRELAIQIKEVFDILLENTGLKAIVLFGGETIIDQMVKLTEGINIIIATPGRLLDLQGRGRLRYDAAEILVLDEADRMLDMGFLPDIKKIASCFYEHPQTMLFSATAPTQMRKLAGISLQNPILVDVGLTDLTPLDTVAQKVIYLNQKDKETFLMNILDREAGQTLVFTRTRRDAERVSQKLKRHGYKATRIHGDIEQSDRMKAVEKFKSGEFSILVATDVASRGLDIEGIAHVINYDLPMAPEDHLHRIGRTARAGTTGKATTFITHDERLSKGFKKALGQNEK